MSNSYNNQVVFDDWPNFAKLAAHHLMKTTIYPVFTRIGVFFKLSLWVPQHKKTYSFTGVYNEPSREMISALLKNLNTSHIAIVPKPHRNEYVKKTRHFYNWSDFDKFVTERFLNAFIYPHYETLNGIFTFSIFVDGLDELFVFIGPYDHECLRDMLFLVHKFRQYQDCYARKMY